MTIDETSPSFPSFHRSSSSAACPRGSTSCSIILIHHGFQEGCTLLFSAKRRCQRYSPSVLCLQCYQICFILHHKPTVLTDLNKMATRWRRRAMYPAGLDSAVKRGSTMELSIYSTSMILLIVLRFVLYSSHIQSCADTPSIHITGFPVNGIYSRPPKE